MPTFTALTTLPGKEAAEGLGAAMENLSPEPTGVGVFEIEDGSGLWEVGGYFQDRPDETALALLAAAFGAAPFAVSELPETDWVAKVKRELAPVRAGRFWLYGSHDAATVPSDVEPLLIEAAMAFGTGHHGTTLGCLKALDRLAGAGEVAVPVADIGCGTAVLAMAAARIWPGTVVAADIDPVAVEVAAANAAVNGLADRVVCLEAAGLDHPEIAAAGPYGLIFANILKAPLLTLAPDIAQALRPGGFAILSGLLNDQSEEVVARYTQCGMIVHAHEEIGDWSTFCLRKI